MILQDVLCTIKDRLLSSGYVNTFYEYCELFKRDNIVQPGYYTGGGQYKPVMDFDTNGAGYARKRSGVSIRENSTIPYTTGCQDDTILDVTYPLRLVLGVPRVKLNDDAYSDDLLFTEIAAILGGNYSANYTIATDVNVTGYDTDSLSIWSNEVKGIDYQMNFRLSYVAIDFNIVFTLNQSCMAQACGYGSAPTGSGVVYFGNSLNGSLDNSGIQSLGIRSTTSFAGTYSFLATIPSEYKYIAYPASWGLPSSFIDPSTNFNVAMNTVYTVTISSILYNVYRTYYPLGGGIDILVQ